MLLSLQGKSIDAICKAETGSKRNYSSDISSDKESNSFLNMAMVSEKDIRAEAKNFCESLTNVFMKKKRDPQTQNLLQKSKTIIESLLAEKATKSERPAIAPKPLNVGGGGGMGQLWVKLDEMKRENEELKKKLHSKASEDKDVPRKSHGPGEVIISELQKYKHENETLKAQLEKLSQNIFEFEKVNATLQDEFKRTKIALKSEEKGRKEREKLEASLVMIRTENESLKKRLNSFKCSTAKRPYSTFAENINEKCRPSNIALSYNNLEAQEWVDAKDSLEESGYDDEEIITRFLCAILLKSYDVNMDLMADIERFIAVLVDDPCKIIDCSIFKSSKATLKSHDEFVSSIKEVLRKNVEGIDVQPLVDRCNNMLKESGDWDTFKEIFNHKSIVTYMEKCVRITLQMVVQETPMWLCSNSTQFDDTIHRLWWACDKTNARMIKYFIWPSLYDSQNGNLLVKGYVHVCAE